MPPPSPFAATSSLLLTTLSVIVSDAPDWTATAPPEPSTRPPVSVTPAIEELPAWNSKRRSMPLASITVVADPAPTSVRLSRTSRSPDEVPSSFTPAIERT